MLWQPEGRLDTTLDALSEATGFSVRQVRYSLNKLEAAGLLKRECRNRGGITLFCQLFCHLSCQLSTAPEQGEGVQEAGKIVSYPAENAEKRVIKPEPLSHISAPAEAVAGVLPQTEARSVSPFAALNNSGVCNSVDGSNGRRTNPSSNPPISPLPSSLPTAPAEKKTAEEKYFLSRKEAMSEVDKITENRAVRTAARDWIAMRYAKRGEHRLTAKAIQGAFLKLRKMEYNSESQAVACFEQSTERLWDGLFELKE